MYKSYYVFYKIKYPEAWYHDIQLVKFENPQTEYKKVSQMRQNGYQALGVTEKIFNLMLAVKADKPI